MALPPDIFPADPDQAALDRASDLIKTLEHACDEGDFSSPALQELRDLTANPRLTVEQYHEVSGLTDMAMRPCWPSVLSQERLKASASTISKNYART
ncbi:hypothetical protein [Halovulum sp. GXIMD14793]